MADQFSTHQPGLDSPAFNAVLVTPDDSNDLAQVCRMVYIGGAGNMKVTTKNGDTVLFSGLTAGSVLPVSVKRIWSTTTTATLIVALR